MADEAVGGGGGRARSRTANYRASPVLLDGVPLVCTEALSAACQQHGGGRSSKWYVHPLGPAIKCRRGEKEITKSPGAQLQENLTATTSAGDGATSTFSGLPVTTLQNPQLRVQMLPKIMNVAVPSPQHSPMLGQCPLSQIV